MKKYAIYSARKVYHEFNKLLAGFDAYNVDQVKEQIKKPVADGGLFLNPYYAVIVDITDGGFIIEHNQFLNFSKEPIPVDAKKDFLISVSWTMTATIPVQADSMEEANQIVMDAGLPDGQYLPDSFQIDAEDVQGDGERGTHPEMRFTPGPWYISRNGQFIRAGSVRGWNIARIEDQVPYTAANARLISAAPDLFFATLLLYPLLGNYPEIYNSSQFKMLCAAIDKVIK